MSIKTTIHSLRYKKMFVLIFILTQIVLAFYIFNYTPQQKNPIQSVSFHDVPAKIKYTINREIAMGTEKGQIFYYYLDAPYVSTLPEKTSPEESRLIWKYDMGAPLLSLVISHNMVLLSASDAEGDLYLFSTQDGQIFWEKNLGRPVTIEGFGGTFGSSGTSAFYQILVVTSDEDETGESAKGSVVYVFTPNSPEPLWEFHSQARKMTAAPSANGDRIIVGDSDGNIYYFNWKGKEPLWRDNLGHPISNVSMTYKGTRMAIGVEGGSPNIFIFDKNGNRLLTYDVPGPIEDLFINSDASIVYAITERTVHGFSEENWSFTLPERIESVYIPPKGKYVLVKGERFYELYYGRSVPLWTKEVVDPLLDATPNGEFAIIAHDRQMDIYSNVNMSPIGSRIFWGIWFLLFLPLVFLIVPKRYLIAQKMPWLIGFLIGIVGFIWSIYYAHPFTFLAGALIIGIAWGISSLVSFSGEGNFYDMPIGWFAGVLSSAAAGCIVGIIYWIQGVEQPLNVEIFFTTLDGLKIGVINSIPGSVVGFLLRRILGDRYG